ncbi:MAG: glutamate racemase [Vicinamibacterales bacterium]
MSSSPIGIFDSGVGGVSVLREVQRELPHEDLLYAADSAHAPYGDKPAEVITARTFAVVDFLIGQGAKAIVIACNTATGIAVDALRRERQVPIVAIEPAIKPAVAMTRSGVVGVLATSGTIASSRFASLLERVAGPARVIPQACPGLVEEIERGAFHSQKTRALVEQYVRPLVDQGADALVLGCTHYPLIADVIADVAGPGVQVIDPAAAVAQELQRQLESRGLLADVSRAGSLRVFSTGPSAALRDVLARLGVEANDVREIALSVG